MNKVRNWILNWVFSIALLSISPLVLAQDSEVHNDGLLTVSCMAGNSQIFAKYQKNFDSDEIKVINEIAANTKACMQKTISENLAICNNYMEVALSDLDNPEIEVNQKAQDFINENLETTAKMLQALESCDF